MMRERKEYDFIFGIGEACSCTQALRSAGLQFASYPMDWLFGNNFEGRLDVLVSEFDKFIEKDDLSYAFSERSISCDAYFNNRNKITFNHDFPAGVSLDISYPMVAQKYNRRINRLLDNIKKADTILIVYVEIPCNDDHITNEDIIKGWLKVNNKYSGKKIDILYFTNDATLDVKNVREENIAPGIVKVVANYKSQDPKDLPYVVNNQVLKRMLNKYRLKMSLSFRVGYVLKKILVKLIPIKSLRKKIKKKYHI